MPETMRSDNWRRHRLHGTPAFKGSRGGKVRVLADAVTLHEDGTPISVDAPVPAGTVIHIGPLTAGAIITGARVYSGSGGTVDLGVNGVDDLLIADGTVAGAFADINNAAGFLTVVSSECASLKFSADLTGTAKVVVYYVTD